ncbi:hypothetical protein DFH06DRAFT_1428042, partial [Mycena polygramma]
VGQVTVTDKKGQVNSVVPNPQVKLLLQCLLTDSTALVFYPPRGASSPQVASEPTFLGGFSIFWLMPSAGFPWQDSPKITSPPFQAICLPPPMSASAPKDRFRAVAIHSVPPQLSKPVFEGKLEAIINDVAKLPLIQKNLLKLEMLFENLPPDDGVSYFRSSREHAVLVVIESETLAHFMEVSADAEVKTILERGKEFGLQSPSLAAFSVDVITKISPCTPEQGINSIGIFKLPGNLSAEDYREKFRRLAENFIEMPLIASDLLRYELASSVKWLQNKVLDHPSHEPMLIIRGESQSWKNLIEIIEVQESEKMILDEELDFEINTDAGFYTVDVVTKINKYY